MIEILLTGCKALGFVGDESGLKVFMLDGTEIEDDDLLEEEFLKGAELLLGEEFLQKHQHEQTNLPAGPRLPTLVQRQSTNDDPNEDFVQNEPSTSETATSIECSREYKMLTL